MAKKKTVKPETKMPQAEAKPRARPVRLDLQPEDYERLDRAAREIGLSKSAYLRMILFQRLKEEGKM